MGMDKSTIFTMLPINERKKGVAIDSSITNLDMARSYDDYPIEDLQVPTLVFHAKDDKLASYVDLSETIEISAEEEKKNQESSR